MQAAMREAGILPEQVDYINAHGTSTPINDRVETVAIKKALGEDIAYRTPVSSSKGACGHLLGAAGAIESLACLYALRESRIPPTVGLLKADPDCDLDYVPGEARDKVMDYVLTNSLGFGGHNATLCFKKYE